MIRRQGCAAFTSVRAPSFRDASTCNNTLRESQFNNVEHRGEYLNNYNGVQGNCMSSKPLWPKEVKIAFHRGTGGYAQKQNTHTQVPYTDNSTPRGWQFKTALSAEACGSQTRGDVLEEGNIISWALESRIKKSKVGPPPKENTRARVLNIFRAV